LGNGGVTINCGTGAAFCRCFMDGTRFRAAGALGTSKEYGGDGKVVAMEGDAPGLSAWEVGEVTVGTAGAGIRKPLEPSKRKTT
jgi:hypothetical protein